jgi:hypothetical protein
MAASNLPIILLAFLIATVVRVSQGSATVSMVTAAGLVAPAVEMANYSAPLVAAIVIAIASGATVLSHVNDSGFWLVGKFLGMTEKANPPVVDGDGDHHRRVGLVIMLIVGSFCNTKSESYYPDSKQAAPVGANGVCPAQSGEGGFSIKGCWGGSVGYRAELADGCRTLIRAIPSTKRPKSF